VPSGWASYKSQTNMKNNKTRVLMCPPNYFDITYEINPWMNLGIKAEPCKSLNQWQNLYNKLRDLDVQVELIKPQVGLPDLVFIDAGFLYKNIFIPSNFKFLERQGESQHFENWFGQNGYKIIKLDTKYKFEGHGDNLWAGSNKVFVGYGFRSYKESFIQIKELIAKHSKENVDFEIIPVRLVDSRFYHLDTCFCPLNQNLALINSKAIDPESLKAIEAKIETIEVSQKDCLNFACNSLVLGKKVILTEGSKNTANKLAKKGFEPHFVDVSEFMKSGGACKCLCMPITDT
jgi:N-dimethylarginine dimethylaminohydrolase